MPLMVRYACFFLIWMLAPGSLCLQEKEHELYEDDEAYQIYVAALAEDGPHQVILRSSELFLIDEEIEAWGKATMKFSGIRLSRKAKREWQPVLEDYVRANQTPRRLVRRFEVDKPYLLVRKCAEKGVWREFKERFPGAWVCLHFSSVGFNRDRTKAVVHFDYSCGRYCGGGWPLFLEKKKDKWGPVKVDATVLVSAS